MTNNLTLTAYRIEWLLDKIMASGRILTPKELEFIYRVERSLERYGEEFTLCGRLALKLEGIAR